MATVTSTVVNGFAAPHQHDAREAQEYEKISKLRDEVFSGLHPRLTVPAHLLRKVSPSSSHLSSHSSVVPLLQLPGLDITREQEVDDSQQNPVASGSHPSKTATPSGIDPVLLTKSDDLIKAELQLQRQRLEKLLRDQFEQKRLDFRKKPSPAEARPDFDVTVLLKQALEVAKPESLQKDTQDKADQDDSFDENSFYSSKAPDSTPEAGVRSRSNSTEERLPVPADATGQNLVAQHVQHKVDNDEEDEEGEYSPPEAVDNSPAHNEDGVQAVPDIRNRQVRRYSDLDTANKRPGSPDANVRIVRNHITSPFAPQPSRVSPLAFTKDALASQDRRGRNGRDRGRAKSNSESPEPVSVRNKKRKLERQAEKARKKRVKQEPVSPPPFHDIQPLGSGKAHNDDRPIVLDEQPTPPSEVRYMPAAPQTYVESPIRPGSRQALMPLPLPLSEPRALSRTTMRQRDDQDLRRVVSMHNMRAEQPLEYAGYATPTKTVSSPYGPVASPMREAAPRYASDYDSPQQEVRVVRTPAPELRDPYRQAEEVRYMPMPPPPPVQRERIIVDEYGRRFREIIEERPPPLARPEPPVFPSRQSTQPVYDGYERARAASVMVDDRRQTRYEPEMPPPRAVRAPTEHAPYDPPSLPAPRESYVQPQAPRELEPQQLDYPARQTVYANDPAQHYPPPRMGSVRPPAQYEERLPHRYEDRLPPTQYEERPPVQYLERPQTHYEERPPMSAISRATSVRPARQGSVFVDDRAAVRPSYAAEQRYRVVEQEPQIRYVDIQGREVPPPSQDPRGIQYVQRY